MEFDKMQSVFKARTGSSGRAQSAAGTGERKICRKNYGAARCLGKFSLLGNLAYRSKYLFWN